MLLLTFVALQAAEPPANLAQALLPTLERCAKQSTNGEVVVCGRREGQSPYRIGPLPPTPPPLPNAEFKISEGSKVKLSAEQGEVGGFTTNRAMVSLKIKF